MMYRFFGALVAALVFMQANANAALVLQFGQGGVVGITEFTAMKGGSITLDLYVTETGNILDPDDNVIPENRLRTLGLGSADFAFTVNQSGVTHADASSFAWNPGLVPLGLPSLSDSNRRLEALAFGPDNGLGGYTPVFPSIAGSRSVRLATATLDIAADTAVDSVQLSLIAWKDVQFDGNFSFTVGSNPVGFIRTNAGTATLNLTAVPEPSSVAVLGMMGVAGVARVVRRRRNKVVA